MVSAKGSDLLRGSSVAKGLAFVVPATIKGVQGGAKVVKGILDKEFGDLPEQCRPQGADFSVLRNIPSRIEYKMALCQEIAQELDIPGILSNLEQILRQASASLFQVLFIGRYSSGKSSILNAFLERPILPEGTSPTTKNLTWLIPGEEEYVICETSDSERVPLPLSELRKSDKTEAVLKARNLFVSVNHPLLQSGVALIDTPGLVDPDSNRSVITLEAIETADAIVFVMDNYISANEKDFLKRLAEEGKTKSLFVLINKIDTIPKDEKNEFIEERLKIMDELGIVGNVFSISAKYPEMEHSEFNRFKNTLIDFMAGGLLESRQGAIESRVNEMVRSTRTAIDDLISARHKPSKERETAMEQMSMEIKTIKEKIGAITKREIYELEKARQAMEANWYLCQKTMRIELENSINQADEENLKRLDLIESMILKTTFTFLSNEIQRVTEQIDRIASSEWSDLPLPVVQEKFEIGPVKPSALSSVPPQLVTAGLLIFSWPVFGLWSYLKLATVTLLGRNLLENFFSAVSKHMGINDMRKQINAALQEKWPVYDEQVKNKINETCDIMINHIKSNEKERISGILWGKELKMKGLAVEGSANIPEERLKMLSGKLQSLPSDYERV